MAFNNFTVPPADTDDDPNVGVPDPNDPNQPGNPNPPQQPPIGTPVTNLPPGAVASVISALQSMSAKPTVAPPDDDEVPEALYDLNTRHAHDDPILFRDGVIDQTMSALIGKDKPNAMLIGHAGVGKTKIAEDIARRLACKDASIPEQIKDFTIYELSLTSLVAGAGIVGDIEARVKTVIDFASRKSNKAILFIDEIHLLCGESQTYSKIAQQLKPALSRGRIRVIGATTVNEAQVIADDPAFNRRFTRIIVDELSRTQTIEVLHKAWPALAKHYNYKVDLAPNTIETCVTVADNFSFQGAHRPDSAITLLDRACADELIAHARRTAIANQSNNQALILAMKAQTQTLVSERALKRTATRLMTGQAEQEDIDAELLAQAFAPVQGQTNAVEQVTRHILRRERGLFPPTRPLSIMFAGPTGVGKTMLAKIIADTVCQSKPIVLNMTEFSDAESVNRIIGAPPGYVGYDSAMELPFDALLTNPRQVILLDEFEKAHQSVQRLFMRVLEEGTIKTSRGKEIDFSRAIIIATTNAGRNKAKNRSLGFAPESKRDGFDPHDLAYSFDMEFLNRFTDIIEFETMPKDTYTSIVAAAYTKEIARIKQETTRVTLPDELDEDTLAKIVEDTYVPEFGARPSQRAVKAWIEDNA